MGGVPRAWRVNRRTTFTLSLSLLSLGPAAAAQSAPPSAPSSAVPQPFTRAEAIASALEQSTRHTIARVDVATASAQLSGARQFENPVLSSSYSGSAPQAHVTLDIPFDWPGLRAPRIAAARAQLGAATVRLRLADVLLAFDTDTTYTRAQTLEAQARLLVSTARDADSLLALVRLRRDAGDASDLDVEIANVSAGQLANTALSASASATAAILRLQLLIGVSPDSTRIVLADTIALAATVIPSLPAAVDAPAAGVALPVAAATLDVRAAEEQARLERRKRIGAPALALGVETINPGGPGGALPLVGVSLPLPLFNRNRAAIARADADVQRGRALLLQTALEQQTSTQLAQTDAAAARRRAEHSLRLLASAERIGALSLLAYREGAATLVNVLEAQRTSRDARAQLLDDLAAVQIAERLQQLLSLRLPNTP